MSDNSFDTYSSSSDDEDTLLHLLLEMEVDEPSFKDELDSEERQIRRRYIPRRCLHDPLKSAFAKAYNGDSEQTMITCTGFDHASFPYLLERFSPHCFGIIL